MLRILLVTVVLSTASAFHPYYRSSTGVVRTASSEKVAVEAPAWHGMFPLATSNAWKRLLNDQMGKREFVGSRARRVAMKVNPATRCVTDEECLLEIEESAEFFEEPPLDRVETLS